MCSRSVLRAPGLRALFVNQSWPTPPSSLSLDTCSLGQRLGVKTNDAALFCCASAVSPRPVVSVFYFSFTGLRERSRGGSGGRPLVACCSSWSRSCLTAAFSAPATMMNPWSFFVLLSSCLIQPRVPDALCVRNRLALLVHGPLQKLLEEIFDVAIGFAGVAINAR